MTIVDEKSAVGVQNTQAIDLDDSWVVVAAEVTNVMLEEKYSQFSNFAERLKGTFQGKQPKNVANALALAADVYVAGSKVDEAKGSGDQEFRKEVDELLERSIATITEVFDGAVRQLNTDLKKVIDSPNGESWGLDLNLQGYRENGTRALVRSMFARNRGTPAQVNSKLAERSKQIEGSFVLGGRIHTDLEKETMDLIETVTSIGNKYNARGVGRIY